jgi:hypothetical protein
MQDLSPTGVTLLLHHVTSCETSAALVLEANLSVKEISSNFLFIMGLNQDFAQKTAKCYNLKTLITLKSSKVTELFDSLQITKVDIYTYLAKLCTASCELGR